MSGAASADDKNTLTVTNLQIGGTLPAAGGTPSAKAAAEAKLTLGASGEIIGTNKFNILAGGELAITGAKAKITAEKGVTLNGGTISVAGAATDAVMDSSLNVTAGDLSLADSCWINC